MDFEKDNWKFRPWSLYRQELGEIRRKRFGIPKHDTIKDSIDKCDTLFRQKSLPNQLRSQRQEFQEIVEPLGDKYTIETLVDEREGDAKRLAVRIQRIRESREKFAIFSQQFDERTQSPVNTATGQRFVALSDALHRLYVIMVRLLNGLEFMLDADDWKEIDNAEVWGLALSGGGIRSAAFNLGILQGLKESGKLDNIDYLSTVSGGGYIGSSLTYLSARDQGQYPFARPIPPSTTNPNIDWIRKNASYLNPGQGLNIWALAAAVGRGIFVNLALLVPMLLFVMWILTIPGEEITTTFQHLGIDAEFINGLLSGNSNGILLVGSAFLGFLLFSLFRLGQKRNADRPVRLRIPGLVWVVFWAVALVYVWINPAAEALMDWPLPLLAGLAVVLFVVVMTMMLWDTCSEFIENLVRTPYVLYILELLSWVITIGILAAMYGISHELLLRCPPILQLTALAGMALVAKLVTNTLFYAFLSSTPLRLRAAEHRYYSVQFGDLLWLGTVLVFLGALPLMYEAVQYANNYKKNLPDNTIESVLSGAGVIATALGWFMRGKGDERVGVVARLLRLGVGLLIIAALLWLYRAAIWLHEPSISAATHTLWYWAVIWLVGVLLIDINYVSLHRYYRNRLMEAFFGDAPEHEYRLKDSGSDNLDLVKIDVGVTNTPYPILNTMLETTGSNQSKYRKRGGDNFVFTPCHLGSESTRWIELKNSDFNEMNLATAMAISGAAVDPIIGHARSRPLRIVMALLNVRLGYWLTNPGFATASGGWLAKIPSLWQESWLWLIGREIFGLPNECGTHIRLTDGGHFENLGLYELVRRKCRHIIVVDAGADPGWTFADLARACERIRVDLSVDIEINTDNLQPRGKSNYSQFPFVQGRIISGAGMELGKIYYLKTALFAGLPEDVLGYARAHKSFPDESTSDQFFSEEQFEAYRELGYQAAKMICTKLQW